MIPQLVGWLYERRLPRRLRLLMIDCAAYVLGHANKCIGLEPEDTLQGAVVAVLSFDFRQPGDRKVSWPPAPRTVQWQIAYDPETAHRLAEHVEGRARAAAVHAQMQPERQRPETVPGVLAFTPRVP